MVAATSVQHLLERTTLHAGYNMQAWVAGDLGFHNTALLPNFLLLFADADIMMPGLWGGLDGAGLTRDLLSAGFDSAMLMISGRWRSVLLDGQLWCSSEP